MGSTAMIASNLVSGGISLISGKQQSDAQRKAGDYYQQESNTNADLAQQQANAVLQAGEQKASIIGLNTREKVGGINAGLSGQGVNITSGTGGALKDQTIRIGAMDALIAKNNAIREASGLTTQANAYRLRGSLLKDQANNQADNTFLTGGLDFARSAMKASFGETDSRGNRTEGILGRLGINAS